MCCKGNRRNCWTFEENGNILFKKGKEKQVIGAFTTIFPYIPKIPQLEGKITKALTRTKKKKKNTAYLKGHLQISPLIFLRGRETGRRLKGGEGGRKGGMG